MFKISELLYALCGLMADFRQGMALQIFFDFIIL